MTKNIGALIVLYEPNFTSFKSTFDSLLFQVDGYCIVDNSRVSHSAWFIDMPNVIYVPLLKNIGIAEAQNIGIAKLREVGYKYILFADQDSIAFPNLVEKLFSAHQLLKENGLKIATVGCNAIDTRTGVTYHNHNVKKTHHYRLCERDFFHVDFVRNSMSLTDIKTLNTVGGMDKELFIDGVDSEWCWRAMSKHGLITIWVNDAYIYHSLGHNGHKIFNRLVTIPSCSRLFFQYRNYFWLLRRGYVPFRWKIRNGVKYIVKIPYYTLMCTPRFKNLTQIAKGLYFGIFTKPKN